MFEDNSPDTNMRSPQAPPLQPVNPLTPNVPHAPRNPDVQHAPRNPNVPHAPRIPVPHSPNAPMAAPAPGAPAPAAPDAGGTANPVLQNIESLGTTQVPQADQQNIYCLNIIGQVEGHVVLPPQNKTTKYEHVIPQLVAAEQDDRIEGILVILNTVGGDVEAGLAIAEMISTMSKPTVTLVLGGGHSIGVPISVSSTYSFIAETATMTIHPIRLTGLVIGVAQSFEYLEKMQERVIGFVTRHSRIDEKKFRELMLTTGELARDIGTTVVGRDAVEYGLINQMGGVGDALRKLNQLIGEHRMTRATGVVQ